MTLLKRILLLSALFLSWNITAQDCLPTSSNASVIISEFSQGHANTNEEFIELMVIGDPGVFDLSGYIIDDNNAQGYGNGNEPGHIRLGDCFSEVKTGTVILLFNVNQIHPNISSSENTMVIPFDSECIIKYPTSPTNHNPAYNEILPRTSGNWTDYIPLHNQGDCIRILDRDKNIVQSVAWGPSSNFVPPFNKISELETISEKAFGITDVNDPDEFEMHSYQEATPGLPNNQTIADDLESMALDPEVLEFNLTSEVLKHDNGAGSGLVKIDIEGGLPPYNVVKWLGGEVIENTGNEVYVKDLRCGEYTFNLEDSRNCLISTSFEIHKNPVREYFVCAGECITIDPFSECDSEDLCYKWDSELILDKEANPVEICPTEDTEIGLKIVTENGDLQDEITISIMVSDGSKILEIASYPEKLIANSSVELVSTPNFYDFYSWKLGEEIVGNGIKLEATTPGVYTLIGLDQYGCEFTTSYSLESYGDGNDYDNDGVPDVDDCEPENATIFQGAPCDDGNDCTNNDRLDENCNCAGEAIPTCVECERGSKCDDGNPCTANDQFDANCNCIGSIIEDCFACEEDSPCDDGDPCTSNDTFDSDCNCIGDTVDNCNECQVGSSCDDGDPCTVNDVFLANCDCRGTGKEDPVIIHIPELICDATDLTLSTSSEYQNYRWTVDGIKISDQPTLVVNDPGEYLLEVTDAEGCTFYSSFFKEILEISLETDKQILCPGESGQIFINNLPSNYDNISWTSDLPGVTFTASSDRININQAGTYTATVDIDGCDLVAEITIGENENLEIEEKLIEFGFEAIDVRILSTPAQVKPNSSSRNNSCADTYGLVYDETQSYIFDKVEDQEYETADVDFICSLLSDYTSCAEDYSAIYSFDACGDNFDDFLSESTAGIDGGFWAFLMPAGEGEQTKLYIKNTIRKNCIPKDFNYKRNNRLFIDLLENILCAYHDTDPTNKNLSLSTEIPYKNFFSGPIYLFDGNYYTNTISNYGIAVKNYRVGKTLDLSNFDLASGDVIDVDRLCYTYEYFNGSILTTTRVKKNLDLKEIWIPYTDGCDEYLKISLGADEFDNFKNLVENAPQIANDQILDPHGYFYKKVEALPICLLNQGTICSILQDYRMVSSNANTSLLSLMNRSIGQIFATLEILQCTEFNKLIKPFHDFVFDSRKERILYFESLLNLYYSVRESPSASQPYGSNEEPDVIFNALDGGGRFIELGVNYNLYMYEDDFAYSSYLHQPFWITYARDYRQVEYFETAPIYVSKHYNFLVPNEEIKLIEENTGRPMIEVPGFYIPYAIYKNYANEEAEDALFALNLVTFAVGFGQLSHAIQLTRVSNLTRGIGLAIGATEIVAGASHILLDETAFCEIEPGDIDFEELCESYRAILPYIDLVLLTGSTAYSQIGQSGAELVNARKAHDRLTSAHNNIIKNFEKNQKLQNHLDDDYGKLLSLMKAPRSNSFLYLLETFEDVAKKYGTDVFDQIKDFENIENLVSYADEIKTLGNTAEESVNLAYKFLQDVAQSNVAGKLGGSLGELNGGVVKAWKVLDDVGDARKLDPVELEKISVYTDAFPSRSVKDEIDELGSYDNWLDRKYVLVDDTWKFFDPVGSSGTVYNNTKGLEEIYISGSLSDFESGVTYLDANQRQVHEVFVQHDRIVDASGNLMDTRNSVSILADGSEDVSNSAIFVMSKDGKFYISKQDEYGVFHHSSFLSGAEVSAAGEIVIENGIIFSVSNKSGHYLPPLSTVESNVVDELSTRSYFFGHNTVDDITFIPE